MHIYNPTISIEGHCTLPIWCIISTYFVDGNRVVRTSDVVWRKEKDKNDQYKDGKTLKKTHFHIVVSLFRAQY